MSNRARWALVVWNTAMCGLALHYGMYAIAAIVAGAVGLGLVVAWHNR